MKRTTDEEEAAGTEYDVKRTKYYKKNSLQHEFSSDKAFTIDTIMLYNSYSMKTDI